MQQHWTVQRVNDFSLEEAQTSDEKLWLSLGKTHNSRISLLNTPPSINNGTIIILTLTFLTDFSFKNSRRGITAIKPKRSGHSFKPSSITKEPLPLSLQWPIADSANGKSSFWFASFGRFILSAFLSLSLFTFRNLFWGAIRRYYFSFSLSFCLFSFDCSGFVISLVFGSWETTWENLLWNFRNYFHSFTFDSLLQNGYLTLFQKNSIKLTRQ